MFIRLDDEGPVYRQIYRRLREAILARSLPPGSRLPSSRRLADELAVARITVVQAYDQHVAEGYLEARRGSGTWVAPALDGLLDSHRETVQTPAPSFSAAAVRAVEVAPATGADQTHGPLRCDFQYGRPGVEPELRADWLRALRRAAERPRTEYPDVMGEPVLRECLAAHLRDYRGLLADPARIMVVSGAQQALTLIGRCILDPGDTVVMEEPHYQGARHAFQALGARLLCLPVDDNGLRTDMLPNGSDHGKASIKLACVTPSHQFPTGGVLPVPRRLELLQWGARHDAWILEDDYDSDYRHEGPPLQSLFSLDNGARVIYTGTLSKVLFPGLRLGYVILPDSWVEPACRLKWLNDRGHPALEQLALAELFRAGDFRRHLERTARRLADRRRDLVEALDDAFGPEIEILGAEAGMHLVARWTRRTRTDAPAIVAGAAKSGVGVYATDAYYANTRPTCLELLLGYATVNASDIRTGVELLRRVLKDAP